MTVVNTFSTCDQDRDLGNFFDLFVGSCLGLLLAVFFALYLTMPV